MRVDRFGTANLLWNGLSSTLRLLIAVLVFFFSGATANTAEPDGATENRVIPEGVFPTVPIPVLQTIRPAKINVRARPSRPPREALGRVDPASIRVWLYASLTSQAHLMKLGADPTTGTRMWENYCRANQIPFARITSAMDIEKVPTTGILLLPSTVVMSESEKLAVMHWRNRGGAILSTWLTGTHSESGESTGFSFMREVLDVEVVGNTEDAPDDTFMIAHGDSPVSHSLLAGTRVWLERVPRQLPIRLVGKQEGAQIMSWSRNYDAQRPAGLLAFNERVMPSGQLSRTVTLGYPEQNWLRSDPKMLGALTGDIFSWLNRQPQAYVGAWPFPYQGGFLLAVQAAEQMADMEVDMGKTFRKMGGKATYYVHGANVIKAAATIKQVKALGHEIGYFGDSFEGFGGQPEATQIQRMDSMQKGMVEAGIGISSPASFSAPLDSYDATTQRLAIERKFGNFLAFMEVSESSLPFAASRDANGLAQTIVLPRTLIGPEEATEAGDPDEGLENFLGGLDLSVRMGGLSVMRIPSQTLLTPVQRKRIFGKVESMRERMWMASAQQIAQWWRSREHVSVSLVPHLQGYLLTAAIAHPITAAEPISIWVNLPRRDSRMRVQALRKGEKVPLVLANDPWRAAIVLNAPTSGTFAWLLQFEDVPSSQKP